MNIVTSAVELLTTKYVYTLLEVQMIALTTHVEMVVVYTSLCSDNYHEDKAVGLEVSGAENGTIVSNIL